MYPWIFYPATSYSDDFNRAPDTTAEHRTRLKSGGAYSWGKEM